MLCWLRLHHWVIDVYRWPLRDLRSGDVGFYCSRCDAVRWSPSCAAATSSHSIANRAKEKENNG